MARLGVTGMTRIGEGEQAGPSPSTNRIGGNLALRSSCRKRLLLSTAQLQRNYFYELFI